MRQSSIGLEQAAFEAISADAGKKVNYVVQQATGLKGDRTELRQMPRLENKRQRHISQF